MFLALIIYVFLLLMKYMTKLYFKFEKVDKVNQCSYNVVKSAH